MKIHITSVFVDDQAKAQRFYCDVLGFKVKEDVPVGEYRWLTVSENGAADEVELLLEPNAHPAVEPYRDALRADGIPLASFKVEGLEAECARLADLGVKFVSPFTKTEQYSTAIIDDTCGNLVQLIEMA